MSKDYNYETRYETLQKDWETYSKQTPRGVTLVKSGNNIYLQFKTPNTSRSKYKCNCRLSTEGMIDAVRKAHRVKEKLSNLSSEVEFWNWYKKEIEEESQLVDDRLTFEIAIEKVIEDFWGRLDRRKEQRVRGDASHESSLRDTYVKFYKFLPQEKLVNLKDIEGVINRWRIGTKTYKGAVSAMKKLAEMNRRRDILDALEALNTVQTEFMDLQSINLEEFLEWRNKVLGVTTSLHPNARLDVRKAWLWVILYSDSLRTKDK